MRPPVDQAPDDTEIAAEYVLRVLSPKAHRAAAVRAATEPAFAAEVRAWEDRLAPMMDAVEPVAPKAATRTALMERLFGHAPIADSGGRTSIWQILAALGFAAAAALAVIAFVPDQPAPGLSDSRFVAELTVSDETTRMFAVLEPASGTVDIAWTARNQAEGRDLQLWGLVDGTEPVSIGVLPAGRTATLALPADLVGNTEGLVLAISDEPLGGSPTGLPTGEVLAAAPVSEI